MFKSIFIPALISLLSLFAFFQSEVSLEINAPESANAGDEFLVEVTINKGDIEGFARFQQDLPVGFTAIPKQTANGKFEFENQKIKIQWMRVPFEQQVTISYAIQVAPTVSGDFNLAGKFSYILNNGVQTATLPPASINIVADETAAGTAASAATTYSYQSVSLKNIDCIRQKPYLNENNEVIVNLLINKGSLRQFGKIQEQIPRGYVAKSIRSKNSIFTFKNSIIKFLWMEMPPEDQFIVSYKLVPEGEIPDQAFIISGTFSYAENERTQTINIAERNVDMSDFQGEDMVAQTTEPTTPTTTEPEPVIAATTPAVAPVITPTPEPVVETKPEPEPIATTPTPQPVEPEPEPIAQTTTLSENTNQPRDNYNQNVAAMVNLPQAEYGIAYRVQIAAGHKLVGKRYFKRLNITDEVQTEIHDGWHKYTVGNFSIYKDAHDYRVYIWNNTPIHDAFVAAYNNGMRITVQEALMIGNQKWYK